MKKLVSKKALALVLALVVLLPAAAFADQLILGSNCSFPPFEYIDDNGAPAGFDIEIGKLVAAKLGKELVVEDMAFDGLILALDSGKIDLAIAAITINETRLAQADFSTPYYDAQQKVLVRADYDGIASLEDIPDKMVAVQEATTGHGLAEKMGVPAEKISAFKNAADAIAELKAGRADCVIIDTAPANVFAAMNPDLVILEGIETEIEKYGIAIKKGNAEVLDAANAVLAEIMANGEYDKLVEQFFGQTDAK